MPLLLTPDQTDFRDAVAGVLAQRATPPRVREAIASDTGHDDELWRRLGSEVGALGVTVPERLGGSGSGQTERAIVAEELGRALAPVPFLGSAVLAVDALLLLDDEDAREALLPGLASGELRGALAVGEDGTAPLDPDATTTRATRSDDVLWTLEGEKTPVIDGAGADVLIVLAGTDDGSALFTVDADAPGLTRTPLDALDLTRRLARVTLADAPAARLDGDATAALTAVADRAAVALGAEQVGGMARAVALTVDYAQTRTQFGRAIGSYQAVKHGCAEMYRRLELTTAVLRHACWVADHDPAELPRAAGLLAAHAGPGFFSVAESMVQYHGGIGYTWEHDAHLFYRRAKSDELLLGGSRRVHDRLAGLLEI